MVRLDRLCGRMRDLDGAQLLELSIADLELRGLPYADACDLHLQCFLAATDAAADSGLPDVLTWTAARTAAWLAGVSAACATVARAAVSGAALCCLTVPRIEGASQGAVEGAEARRLRDAIRALMNDDEMGAKWLVKWSSGMANVDVIMLHGEA